jgi:hypothetical protein
MTPTARLSFAREDDARWNKQNGCGLVLYSVICRNARESAQAISLGVRLTVRSLEPLGMNERENLGPVYHSRPRRGAVLCIHDARDTQHPAGSEYERQDFRLEMLVLLVGLNRGPKSDALGIYRTVVCRSRLQ